MAALILCDPCLLGWNGAQGDKCPSCGEPGKNGEPDVRRARWHKYKNKPTTYNGVRYASKREANRAELLDTLVRTGDVVKWDRQVRFGIPIISCAGKVEHLCDYIADFVVEWTDGHKTVEDAKGFRTPVYSLKKKLMRIAHGIDIVEV